MKKIAIVGGFGFLGKNLQDVFSNTEDYQVHCYSRQNGYDLSERTKLADALKTLQPEYVINAAASVGSLEYVNKHAADVITANLLLGINLWEILKEIDYKGVVVNPISNCTYPGNIAVQKESEWWDGMVHPSIISYGSAKKTIYMLNRCYEKQYGIKTINFIMSNAYGPYDYDDENKVHALNGIVIRMLKKVKAGEKEFIIWGSGTPIREWAYMPDIARFVKYIVDKDLVDLPNPINIGQEKGYSINEISNIIQQELDPSLELKNDLTKIDGDPVKVLSSTLFRTHFPDFEFTDIETGIKNTINYYKDRI